MYTCVQKVTDMTNVTEEEFGYVKGWRDKKSSSECNDSESDMALPEPAHKRKLRSGPKLQWTSNVFTLWDLMTFHPTSVFFEDKFQYTISPSQVIICQYRVTIQHFRACLHHRGLMWWVSEPHPGCFSVYHWDSRKHSLKHVWPQEPSYQPLMMKREKVSEPMDTNYVLTWLVTQEDLIGYRHHDNFKTYESY